MLDELIRRPSRNRLAVVAGAGVFLYRGVVVQQVPASQVPVHGHTH